MNNHTRPTQLHAATAAANSTRWPCRLGVLALVMCVPILAQAGTLSDAIKQGRSGGLEGPCPFFDAAVVQKVFPDSSNEAAFKRRDKPYPSCTYIWKGTQKKRMKIGEQEIMVPSQGRLTLTIAPSSVAANDWKRVLMGYRNQQLTPVPELGDYAIWSPQRRQLSWIAKGRVFHVAVEDDDHPETQQSNAMLVAAELLRTH